MACLTVHLFHIYFFIRSINHGQFVSTQLLHKSAALSLSSKVLHLNTNLVGHAEVQYISEPLCSRIQSFTLIYKLGSLWKRHSIHFNVQGLATFFTGLKLSSKDSLSYNPLKQKMYILNTVNQSYNIEQNNTTSNRYIYI